MKRIVVILFFLGLTSSFALAQSSGTPVVSKSGPYQPLGYCQITSLGSAVALVTASCANGSVPGGATIAQICVSTANVRYRDDGVNPTTSIGMPVLAGTCYAYAITPLSQAVFIAVSGSPVLDISFYR